MEYDAFGRKSVEKHSGDLFEKLYKTYPQGYATDFHYNSPDLAIDPQPGIDRNELILSGKFPLIDTVNWNVDAATLMETERGITSARNYQYDPIGNRSEDGDGFYATNALNQYESAPYSNAAWTYDANGNLTGDGDRTYQYDAENRLVQMTELASAPEIPQASRRRGVPQNSGAPGNEKVHHYTYDYLGRRISKTLRDTETRFVYDGWNLIAETDASGNATRSFVWGRDVSGTLQGAGGVGGLLAIKDESNGNTYYPQYDSSHNVVGLKDQTGAIAAAYDYDPYGNIVQSSGGYAKKNPFRYSTKYTDDETAAAQGPREGLVYYGLRFYNPKSGRFINKDPIGEAGGANLYAFVGNNPSNGYDYLGLCGMPSEPVADDEDDDASVSSAEWAEYEAELAEYEQCLEDEYLNRPWHNIFGYDSEAEYLADGRGTFRQEAAAKAHIARNGGIIDVFGRNPGSFGTLEDQFRQYKQFQAEKARREQLRKWKALINEARSRQSAGSATQTPATTELGVGYTKVVGKARHAFVVATDPVTGEQYAIRAGPSRNPANSSRSSGSGPSARPGPNPNSPSGAGFGTIYAEAGPYDATFTDHTSNVNVVATQSAGTVNMSFAEVVQSMSDFANSVNNAGVNYWPLGRNSNSTAFSYLDSVGVNVQPTESVPGYRRRIP